MAATGVRVRPQLRKFVKYTMASMVGTVFGQGSLVIFTAVLDWPGVQANLSAVTIGAVPNYLANRYWTWQKRGRNHLFGEVLPFWGMTLLGLGLSTACVAYADHRWGSPLSISLASMTGFASVWVAKFFVLDRLLFGGHRHGATLESADPSSPLLVGLGQGHEQS